MIHCFFFKKKISSMGESVFSIAALRKYINLGKEKLFSLLFSYILVSRRAEILFTIYFPVVTLRPKLSIRSQDHISTVKTDKASLDRKEI